MNCGDLGRLETPCLVLERGKLERNIARMREHLAGLKVALRPHVKTAKSFDVARLALAGQPGGITVSTLKEAEQFFASGVTDILYAVGITPNKLDHVAALRKKGADVTVILDNAESARMVAALLSSRVWVPLGNTGRARVSAFRPMPVPPDLRHLVH